MKSSSARTIRVPGEIDADIAVPPSKSYTNRALIASSIAAGSSIIRNPSRSEDTEYLKSALREFGVRIDEKEGFLEITGTDGRLSAPRKELYIGNAGTAMRFLASIAALAPGTTRLAGDRRMNTRPMQGLLDALNSMGITCTSQNGFSPLTINGGKLRGGRINVDCEKSSQFLSSLLLISPYAQDPAILHTAGSIPSSPYIDMTIHTMRAFGAEVNRTAPDIFTVGNKKRYSGTEYTVEGDASSATYFFAAAAVSGGRIGITNLDPDSLQGDLKFLDILSSMGSTVMNNNGRLEVRGNLLRGVQADMKDIPDSVPSLAVAAAFASGPTLIKNIRNLRYKESDRITALSEGLRNIGCITEAGSDWLKIIPGKLHGAVIETHHDHRIAMSFAAAGLKLGGISVTNPDSVNKSYPDFWKEIEKLENR